MTQSGPGHFLYIRFLTKKLNLQISLVILCVLVIHGFEELVHFIQIVKFHPNLCMELFIVFSYYPFNICRVCSNTSSFIPDTIHVFFFVNLVKSYQFCWFSLLFQVFNFIDFSSFGFILPFCVCVCVLRWKLRLSIWELLFL